MWRAFTLIEILITLTLLTISILFIKFKLKLVFKKRIIHLPLHKMMQKRNGALLLFKKRVVNKQSVIA